MLIQIVSIDTHRATELAMHLFNSAQLSLSYRHCESHLCQIAIGIGINPMKFQARIFQSFLELRNEGITTTFAKITAGSNAQIFPKPQIEGKSF